MNPPVLPLRAEAVSLPDASPTPAATCVPNPKALTIDSMLMGLNSVDTGCKSNSYRKKPLSDMKNNTIPHARLSASR
jgi:hypothetical protein